MLRLSLQLGIPISELQQRLSSADVTEYLAFYTLEPFGDRQDDLRFGMLFSMLSSAWGSSSRSPASFFPSLGEAKRQQTDEEMLAIMNALVQK